MKVTYYGHACFGVETAGKHLLFDPFISPNELARHVNVDAVPADYILASHGHMDHVADVARIAKRTGATLISNFEITVWFSQQGVAKTHPMNHGGAYGFDFGRVKYVNAIHSSSLPDGAYGGNPGGFVVETREGNFYYSGDTALTQDMKLIPEFTRLRFAALPVGDNFTMGTEEALKAAEFVQVNDVMGVHYDTFPPIRIDRAQAIARFKAAGKTLHLPEPGASITF